MGEQTKGEVAAAETPEAISVADEAAAEGEAPARRRRAGRWFRRATGGLFVLVILGVAWLSQTDEGQQRLLDELLGRISGSLAGELAVEGIRSGTLLTGVTLTGVRLDAEGGRRVLEADSVVVRYSPFSLLLGSPRIWSTTLHGMDLEISRYPGDDYVNVTRILAASDAADSTPSRPRTIQLGRIGVRRGTIEILTPADGAPGELTVPAPGGEPLRRMAFESVDLDIEETVLRPGGAVTFDARLASLTAAVFLLKDPLVIREAFGDLSFGTLGLEIEGAAFRLAGTLLEGALKFGPVRPGDPWTFAAELGSDGWGDLADLMWIDPRIPSGRFRGGADVRTVSVMEVALRDFEVQLEASTIIANGRARFGDALVLRSMQVTASPLALSRIEPWLGRDLPLGGFLSGQATFSGSLDDLEATGRVTLVPTGTGGLPTTADFTGTVHSGDDPGATDLRVRLDPLNYRVLEALWPGARALGGEGSGSLEVNGRADEGLLVVADFAHSSEATSTSTSRILGRGLFRRLEDRDWLADVRGELAPLSLPLLGAIWPELEVHGAVAGPVRVDGRLSALNVSGDLTAGDGRLTLDGTFDLSTPGSRYRLDAEAEELRLSAFNDELPDPTTFSGSVALRGTGFALDSLEASLSMNMRASRVGAIRLDSLAGTFRASRGLLTVDTLSGVASGVRVAGRGSLGLIEEAYGEASFEVSTESLLGLRPLFMGDSILVGDDLNPLEEDLLRVRGIDPDTLPSEMDVRMAGSVVGTAALRGWLRDLDLDLLFEVAEATYGHNEVDSARVSLMAGGLPATLGEWEMDVEGRGLVWGGRSFQRVNLDGHMYQRRGEGTLDILRRRNERYFLTGAFALDSVGGQLDLTDASIQLNDLSWTLSAPTRMAWNENSVSVDSLEITRVGEDPMWLTAAGTLTRGGDSDFRLSMEGFHVEQALQIVQREDLDMSGHVDLSLTVVGPSERPVVDALVRVEDPAYGAVRLSRLSGSMQYEDRLADFRIDAWDGERNVLTAVGTLPVDLALTEVDQRSVSEPMDVRVTADSLDAAIALAYLHLLENVTGTVSADVRIGGTSREPEPSGTVRLADAAWTIDALGVRHTGVAGEILLRPDKTVGVTLGTSRSGTSTVSGVVTMEPFADPALDLTVTFDRFQAVQRRDMQSMISGEFRLGGTFRLPVAEGALTVDEGTLFVEEFARSAGIVDLADPLLYTQGLAVDTTVFVTQPFLAGVRNPFLDNLRVDIDLSVPRNMWLRSNDMNVEMGGELLARYDRRQGDLVLVGELEALRGSYLVLGRTFEVDGGTVAFEGQPGVNPTLDIQARSRIRRPDSDPLEVVATVEGTLVQPLVTLSTEEAGLAQSDLISYLVFGRSSGELGTGTSTGNALRQDIGTGVGTYVTGALANQVGSALAQEIGLVDYLAISQAGAFGGSGVETGFARNLARSTQVEAGWYLDEDLFVILVLGSRDNGTSGDEESGASFSLRGVRLELALTDAVFVEGFMEDRFLRSGTGGLGTAGLDGDQVLGLFVFREWGYGSQQ